MSDEDLIKRGEVKALRQAFIHYSGDYPDGRIAHAVTVEDIDRIPPAQEVIKMEGKIFKVRDILNLCPAVKFLVNIYDLSENKKMSYSDNPIYLDVINPEDKIFDCFIIDMYPSFYVTVSSKTCAEDLMVKKESVIVLSVSKTI